MSKIQQEIEQSDTLSKWDYPNDEADDSVDPASLLAQLKLDGKLVHEGFLNDFGDLYDEANWD